MKRWMMHSMMAAAAVLLAAGSASAQTVMAEIPFAFQVGTKVMAPGTYQVQVERGAIASLVLFRNLETKTSALAQFSPADAPKEWQARGTAMMRFACSGAQCVVREMWTGANHSYRFSGPKPGADARIAEIAITAVKAD